MSFFAGFFFATTLILSNVVIVKHFLGKDK
jgi:hypothetical protein